MKNTVLSLLTACTLGATLMPSALQAQNGDDDQYHPLLSDRFSIGIGLFRPNKDFKIRVDGEIPGEEIDLEQEADASETETTGAVDFIWQFG
jgi:hypothetical protein